MDNDYPDDPRLEKLMPLLACPKDVPRMDYLHLAAELAGKGSALFLWLWDGTKKEFVLDAVAGLADDDPKPAALCRKWMPALSRGTVAGEDLDVPTGLPASSDPEVRAWLVQHGLASDPFVCRLEFTAWGSTEAELLGYIQLFSLQPLGAAARHEVSLLMSSFSQAITRSRRWRRLRALKTMQEGIDLTKPTQGWFDLAANTLLDLTKAELCLVLQMQTDLSFAVVAGAPGTRASTSTKRPLKA